MEIPAHRFKQAVGFLVTVYMSKDQKGGQSMQNRRGRNTKKKIVSAAWKLFYEQGYDNTTVDDIIDLSGTSKGSFYHYFEGKDALLSTLSFLFDEKYEELIPTLPPEMDSYEKLLYLNQELFSLIENTISLDLLARLYSTQLTTKGEKHLLDHNRGTMPGPPGSPAFAPAAGQ